MQRRWPALVAGKLAAPLGAAVLAGIWILAGPYPDIYSAGNSYAHHNIFQTYRYAVDPYWPSAHARAPDAPVHPWYRELDEAGEDVPLIVEWPAVLAFPDSYYHISQAWHRRPVRLLAHAHEVWWSSERLALASIVVVGRRGSVEALPAGTRIVLHRNPLVERARFFLGVSDWVAPSDRHARDYAEVVTELTAACGPPVFEDGYLTVFRVPG